MIIIPIVLGKKIFEYYLGWKDEKIGYWPFLAEYLSRNVNPFDQELMERVKRIEHYMKNSGMNRKK